MTAHLGRPKPGADNSKYSLAPVAGRLGELLGTEVTLADHGDEAQAAAGDLADGGVVLLENIRFDPRETSKDDAERGALAAELAALAGADGAFVSDGFGVVHRKQASVYDVAPLLAGLHRRAGAQRGRRAAPAHRATRSGPTSSCSAARRCRDKLPVIESLLPKVDSLLVGGGMCFTFLAAQGYGSATRCWSPTRSTTAAGCWSPARSCCRRTSWSPTTSRPRRTPARSPVDAIPDGWKGLDIGPESVAAFARRPRRREDGLLERPDGRVRAGPVRRGHPRRRPGRSSTPPPTRGVQRRRRWRLGRGRPRARPARGRVLPHLHRRRRVAGVPGGQGAPRHRRSGGAGVDGS